MTQQPAAPRCDQDSAVFKHQSSLGRGLFLRPQHFQHQDAYHEWRLAQVTRLLHPYAWGLRSIQIDADALQTGMLRVLELQAVLPDGELATPRPKTILLPPPVCAERGSLTYHKATMTIWSFFLALAPLRHSGTNMAASREAADVAVRYFQHPVQAADVFAGSAIGSDRAAQVGALAA